MKKQTRILKIFLALALVCAMVFSLASCASGANADSANGTHGSLAWSYEKDTKTLTVTGAGALADFASADEIVWGEVLTSAEKLVVSEGITSIGNYAFYYMPKLTSVTLPSTLTSIGNYAFAFNTTLASVTIPDTVTSIGVGAFEGCGALTSVYLPASVTSIGQRAFAYCYSMTGAVFTGESVSVGAEAFKNCRSMSALIVRDTVSADMIDASAFNGAAVSFENATRTDNPEGSTTVTVAYMQDGAQVDGYVNTYSYGQSYSIPTPTKEGYTADILTVVGSADGKAHNYTVTYTANATEESAPASDEPAKDENEEDKKVTPTAIIAIVIMVVVLIAIAVGAFLLMRSDKKPAKKNASAPKNAKGGKGVKKK